MQTVWNSADMATATTAYSGNQKCDTCFAVNVGAINFKRGLKCSSSHRWSADTKQDDYISVSQRAIASSQCSKRHQKWDTFSTHELDKPVWCLQFSTDTHLPHSGHRSLSPLRHVLLSVEASWNLLDVATFNVSYIRHQKWNTTYFISGPPTWSWFSANTEAINFTHGLMCTSLCSWFYACNDTFSFLRQRENKQFIWMPQSKHLGFLHFFMSKFNQHR